MRAIAMIKVPAVIVAMNIYDGSTFLGTTTTDANGSWHFVAAGLFDGTHRFTAADTDTAGNTSAASQPVNRTVVPSITSFSATPRTSFFIDGISYEVLTAGKGYSLTSPDAHTLRFEIRPGDHAWFDGANVDRSQIERLPRFAPGTPVNIGYQFMLEPGAANMAGWFVTAEMHNDDEVAGVSTSPPFDIGLDGEHLQVVAKYCPTGLNPSNAARNLTSMILWTDPNPIQRGQYYDIQIQANVANNNSGYLDVRVNGKQVVNYDGPLGYGYPTYWIEGPYRSADASETVAANFRNLTITTGSR